MLPQAVRPLALTAMAGGALYVVSGVAQLASPGQTDPFSGTPDYLIQFLRTLSLLLTLAGFVALHLVFQAGGYRDAGLDGVPRGRSRAGRGARFRRGLPRRWRTYPGLPFCRRDPRTPARAGAA